ncbi:hypothetical protein BDZ89DRAFT_1169674 [Hymenopellis radicata]|nr:hypothetical protein BDZ89DRAFT_1169674 [Hymenopellis radicata]
MVNRTGKNGSDCGTRPPDDLLTAELRLYEQEGLSQQTRIDRLKNKFDYKISKSTLNKLHNELGIQTARKTRRLIGQDVATSLVADVLDDGLHERNSPAIVRQYVQLRHDISIPRDMVRVGMSQMEPAGAAKRQGGKLKQKIPRKALIAVGPWSEFSCDGHEKLSTAALRMGPVGIPIYEIRDKASGYIVDLRVVPNARLSDTIGHVYLDMAEEWSAIPLQITTDKGSEVGLMYALQLALRKEYAPDIDEIKFPACVGLKSTRNITAEQLWHWMREKMSFGLEDIVKEGQTNGLFLGTDDTHVNLFNWLWPQIVQSHLDEFKTIWNRHKRRDQHQKLLPSATSPANVFENPQGNQLERTSIEIDRAVIPQLRAQLIETSREEAYRWVSDEFRVVAEWAYESVGCPTLHAKYGWNTYSDMLALIESYYRGEIQ